MHVNRHRRILNRQSVNKVYLPDGQTWSIPDPLICKIYNNYYGGDIYTIPEFEGIFSYDQILALCNQLVAPLSEFPVTQYNVVMKHFADYTTLFIFYKKFDPACTEDLHQAINDLVFTNTIVETREFLRRMVDRDAERLFDEYMYQDNHFS